MSTRDHTDLINGELDGTNTGDQSAELRAWFDQNPGEREQFDVMQTVVGAMEAEGFHEAPEGHLETVVASIPFRLHPAEEAARPDAGLGWYGWLRDIFSRPALRFAGAFGVGLVAGAVVWSAAVKRSVDTPLHYTLDIADISGTMKSVSDVPGYTPIGELEVRLEGVEGRFQLHRHESGEALLAEVELHSDAPIEWVLEYDSRAANLEGFRRYTGSGGSLVATDSPTLAQTRTSHEGDGRYVLFFSTRDGLEAPMTVRIFSSEELLFEDLITETGMK